MEEAEGLAREVKRWRLWWRLNAPQRVSRSSSLTGWVVELERQIAQSAAEREEIVRGMTAEALALFESVARKRSGVAVVRPATAIAACATSACVRSGFSRSDATTASSVRELQRILYFAAPAASDQPAPADE